MLHIAFSAENDARLMRFGKSRGELLPDELAELTRAANPVPEKDSKKCRRS